MGSDPKTSVVNRYGQSWDIPNLFVIGSSTFPTMSGFNPTLTIQALAYMSADAIVNRYRKNPGRAAVAIRWQPGWSSAPSGLRMFHPAEGMSHGDRKDEFVIVGVGAAGGNPRGRSASCHSKICLVSETVGR